MAHHYREKSQSCVDEILTELKQTPPGNQGQPTTAVGFLAQLFKDSPQERERILKAESSNYVKSVELLSLYIAGLPDEAQKFAAENYLSVVSAKMHASNPTTLEALRPSSTPGDNDMLIGAYMASGNAGTIQRILENYSSADDAMVSDAFRMGFMMSKFGTGLAPKGRDPVMMQAACNKYQCKMDQLKFFRVLTLATAIWSLQSLANQDDGIKTTLSDFLAHDSRLKVLFATEQTAFGNYLAAIVVVSGLKSDHTGAEAQRGYAAMSESASIYENLGSAKDAFAPFANLKK